MQQQNLLIALVGALVLLMTLGVVWLRRRSAVSSYGALRGEDSSDTEEEQESEEEQQEREQRVRDFSKKQRKRRAEPTIEERLFIAGKITPSERSDFHRKRKLAPLVFGGVGLVIGILSGNPSLILFIGIIGVILGFYIPLYMLTAWEKKQHEELSYYLPLVIEQVAIGVSSSLDVGPCLSKIVEMSDDRASHNAVTRLIKHSLMLVKSGLSLEEALGEVGKASGHPELKHTTLALSQVAKYGGEISKQLQDLADSVATQREARIDATIRKLELKATGPVALVFVAYMMLIGLGVAALLQGQAL
jgi:Flp pilus assembly protein TadB